MKWLILLVVAGWSVTWGSNVAVAANCLSAANGSETQDGYLIFRIAAPPQCGGTWPPSNQAYVTAGYCYAGDYGDTYPGCRWWLVMSSKCPIGQSWKDSISACTDDSKQGGPQQCGAATPYPIALGTGNKYLQESDLFLGKINLQRTYNRSHSNINFSMLLQSSIVNTSANSPLLGWTFAYQQRLRVATSPPDTVWAIRPAGQIYRYKLSSTLNWGPDRDVTDRLIEVKDSAGTRTGWRYFSSAEARYENFDANGALQNITRNDGSALTLTYTDGTDGITSHKGGYVLDASGSLTTIVLPPGLLLRVADSFGNGIEYGYDVTSRVTHVADPAGGSVHYTYDTAGNISTVTYPDSRTKTYLYGEAAYIAAGSSQPDSLTGILDENGNRYASYWYDTDSRAYDEVLAEGSLLNIGRSQISYTGTVGSITSTAVTDALGTTRTLSFRLNAVLCGT